MYAISDLNASVWVLAETLINTVKIHKTQDPTQAILSYERKGATGVHRHMGANPGGLPGL